MMMQFDLFLLLSWQGVFLLGYLAVFITLWRNLYSRHIAPGLAAAVLLIYLCSVGFTGLLYQYFGCDPLVLYFLLVCYGIGLAVWLGRMLWRHRREMISRVLLLLGADLAVVLFLTLASRLGDPTRGGLQLMPLWNIIQAAQNGSIYSLEHPFLNVLLFVPTGYLLAQLGPKPLRRAELNFLAGLVLSIAIETFQLAGHLGLCDINDVISNALGAAAGAFAAKFLPLEELWKMLD